VASDGARRKKVAILGGGLGALSAAFELTSTGALRGQYEVTIYQLGWRLGGKGASGRERNAGWRIQEHGLHMWMGWYQNAFHLIRRCYEEWQADPGSAFSTWRDAFKPRNDLTFMDRTGESGEGAWSPWRIRFPANEAVPGEGEILEHSWDYAVMMIVWIESVLQHTDGLPPPPEKPRERPSIVRRVLEAFANVIGLGGDASAPEPAPKIVHPSLLEARRLVRALPRSSEDRTEEHHATLLHLLREAHDWLERETRARLSTHASLRHAYVLLNLAYAVFRGLMAEGFPRLRDFDKFDDLDLRAWLRKHGAAEVALESGVLRSFYELGFCYEAGDFERPAVAAGAALRALMRMGLGYKGAVLYAMQAGMGDTVFTPMYEVLTARGVRVRFFSKVESLHLDQTGRLVERIDIQKQVDLKSAEYDPLVRINGLGCWPSEPRWDQIQQGESLQEHQVDLESHWSDWKGVGHQVLRHGEDFDLVVFGLSIGSIPFVCRELLANERWQRAVEHVKTVQTQAIQLWLLPDRRGLGWPGEPTVLTSYEEPFSTWADMSHLIVRERWLGEPAASSQQWPGSIAYLCGAMPGPDIAPPADRRDYPVQEAAKVRQEALRWLPANAGRFWPRAVQDGKFRWDLLVDLEGREGAARVAAQFWRANVNPSERYVQTPPGSTRHRLHSDDPDFDNLYLAGDWVFSCINGGCVEGAVVGGMQASRAICGVPQTIQGE
jgi:uncharacterized protein with NAD-binding domain and iron-sulfur cluster